MDIEFEKIVAGPREVAMRAGAAFDSGHSPDQLLENLDVSNETLARTTLGSARVGEPVHLEADLVGKWIERLVRRR